MYTRSQNIANFGLTCVPEKGHGFVTVRAVTANLVSKDARDFKEKSHETARRDLLALQTYRVKRLGGIPPPPPPASLGLKWKHCYTVPLSISSFGVSYARFP